MEELTDEQLIEQIMAEGTPELLEYEVISEDRVRVKKMKYKHALGDVENTIDYVNSKEHPSKFAQKNNQKTLTKAEK
jgi:hypothetical protein